MPGEGEGDKQDRAFGEVRPPGDVGVGEGPWITLKGEEQGGALTVVGNVEDGGGLKGEGERCLRLGLKAEGTSASLSGLEMLGLGLSTGTGALETSSVTGCPDPGSSGSLQMTEKQRVSTETRENMKSWSKRKVMLSLF